MKDEKPVLRDLLRPAEGRIGSESDSIPQCLVKLDEVLGPLSKETQVRVLRAAAICLGIEAEVKR